MTTARALASNSAVIAGSRIVAGLGRAAAMMVAARNVPVGDFGRLALAFALVDIFRQFADFGLEVVTTRHVARAAPGGVGELAGTALALKTTLGLVSYGALLLLVAAVHGPGLLPVTAFVGLMVITWSASTAVAAYFQGRLAMVRVSWTAVVGTIVTFAIVMAVAESGRSGLLTFAGGFVLGDIIAGTLATWVLHRAMAPRLRVRRPVAWELLRTAWPVAITQLLVIAYFRLDVIMLGWLGRVEDVGLYGVAFKITEPLLLAPAAIAASFYGAAAPLWDRGGSHTAMRLYRRLAAMAAAYGVSAATVLTVGASPLVAWLVPGYTEAALALRVLSWSLAFMGVNMVTTAALNSQGAYGVTAAIATATLSVCFVANALLIPRFGIVGASAATVITEAVNGALQLATLAFVSSPAGARARVIIARVRSRVGAQRVRRVDL